MDRRRGASDSTVTQAHTHTRGGGGGGVTYQQCSQEVPAPSCSATSSFRRGRSPNSDILAGPLEKDSGLHVSVDRLLLGGGWGSSPGRLLSVLSCLDCSHQQCLPGEGPACGSANKPALSAWTAERRHSNSEEEQPPCHCLAPSKHPSTS